MKIVWLKPLLLMIWMVITPAVVLAQEGSGPTEGCNMGQGLVGPIVNCVTAPLEDAATTLFSQLYVALEPAIAGFLVLAVVGFGLKIASGGVRRPFAEIGVMVAKLAAVIYVLEEFPAWYPEMLKVMEDLLGIVTEPLLNGVIACPEATATTGGISAADNVWARIDCILGTMFGVGTIITGGSVVAGGLLTTFMGNAFNMTDIGVMVAMAGFGMGLSLFLSVGRAVIGFIAAKLVIAFLVGLAPLFMPFIMLRGTFTYFNKWVMGILSYMIQPMVLLAFLCMFIVSLDYAVFRGDYSIATVLMSRPATSLEDFQEGIARHLEENTCTEFSDIALVENIPDLSSCQRILQELGDGAGTTALSETMTSMCDQLGDVVFGAMRPLEGAANIGVAISHKLCDDQLGPFLLIQLIVVALMCILMYMLSEVVPDMARDMVFSPRIAKLGSMEVPGEGVLGEFANPENMSNIMNMFRR